MRKHHRTSPDAGEETEAQRLRRRLQRFRRRGENRNALLALRTAALQNEEDAKVWTLYAAECARLGKTDTARQAYHHAVWLRERARQHGKAQTTRRLLEQIDSV